MGVSSRGMLQVCCRPRPQSVPLGCIPLAASLLLSFVLAGEALNRPLCREVYEATAEPWRNCSVQIGGLAISGSEAFLLQFNLTFEAYLTSVFNDTEYGLEFEVLPLNFDQNFEYVSGRKLDYIYSNPAAYTCMMAEFAVVTIASMVNFRKGNALEKFAGVIFTRNDSDIVNISDLTRASVAAVSISGLGAMQLQQAELLDLGIDVMTDVERLIFTGSQGKIVADVEAGYVDVGFVRTDMIDRSVAAGTTQWETFRVLNLQSDDGGDFPFKRSTAFTPEWPIGGLVHVPHEINALVAQALWALDRDSDDPLLSTPGVIANFATWIPPMNYLSLLAMLDKIGYYDPTTRTCLRNKDVYKGVQCPAGYVKQSEDKAFCADDCKTGYTCLCKPCSKLQDPSLVLEARLMPTAWPSSVNSTAAQEESSVEDRCERMGICAKASAGYVVEWTLLDRIGSASRLQINAELFSTVEILVNTESDWQPMALENITLENGLPSEKYSYNDTTSVAGTHVVQVRINGEQATMSPVVMLRSETPLQTVVCDVGEQAQDDGSCTPCPAGTFGVVERDDDSGREVYQCRPCLRGMYQSNVSQSSCKLCPSGHVAPQEGSSTCDACLPGSSTLGREGRATCEACEPGQAAGLAGMERCTSCLRGTYSSTSGSSMCLECPAGTTTQELGSANASACGCPEDTYMVQDSGPPYCQTCPEGAVCPGFASAPLIQPGYFIFADAALDSPRLDIYLCGSKNACPGQEALGDELCADQRMGLNCAKCIDGWVGSPTGSECSKCGALTQVILPILLLILIPGLATLHYFWNHGKAAQVEAVEGMLFSLTAGTTLVFIQNLSLFERLNVRWSEDFQNLLNSLKFVLFDLSGLQLSCYWEATLLSSYSATLAVPILLALSVAALKPFSVLLHRWTREHFPKFTWEELLNTGGLVLMTLYISVCESTLSIVDCYSGPNGKGVVRNMPFATCSGDEYFAALPLFAFAVLLYFVAVTAAMVYVLWVAPVKFANNTFRASVRFLVFKFHPKAWWYSLVLNIRSLLLAMVTVAFPDNEADQVISMIIILTSSLWFHLLWMPYTEAFANWLECWEIFCLVLVLVVGGLGAHAEDVTPYGVLCIILVSLVIAACIGVAAWAFYLAANPKIAHARHRKKAEAVMDHFAKACHMVSCSDLGLLKDIFVRESTSLELGQSTAIADWVLLHMTGIQPSTSTRRRAQRSRTFSSERSSSIGSLGDVDPAAKDHQASLKTQDTWTTDGDDHDKKEDAPAKGEDHGNREDEVSAETVCHPLVENRCSV
mmetsp:Transcript_57396/g.122054  ORF Transcript_57396/g.122054 Transcript_57396/m.122054 type:complete len:1291 (+) Transcript_57396:186-4058(+)